MPQTDPTIERFRKMAQADPDNELGHFSLGKACLDAGLAAQAIPSFQRALELNPNITRAYQLLAAALLKENRKAQAIECLNRGVEVAAARGDLMPKKEMIAMLSDLGAPIPQSVAAAASPPVGEGQVLCNRCGRVGRKLPSPPFSNAQGKEIYAKICADCWRQWIAMGTKVINELRLPLADPQAQKIFDQHMKEFLNL